MSTPFEHLRGDKRASRRVRSAAPVGIAVVHGPLSFLARHPRFRGTLCDESTGGLQLCTKQPVLTGATLKLWIGVPAEEPTRALKLLGDVVWSRRDEDGSFRAGIRLRDGPGRDKQLWTDIVVDDIRRLDA